MTGRQFAAEHGDPAEADRATDPLANILGGMTAADGTPYLDIYREAQAAEADEN